MSTNPKVTDPSPAERAAVARIMLSPRFDPFSVRALDLYGLHLSWEIIAEAEGLGTVGSSSISLSRTWPAGGEVGLMGVVADAVLATGGEVVGVIPKALLEKEVGHEGLTDLRVVGSMHERRMLMADLSDGFVALPGGYGTLEEFSEVLSWAQLSLHEKPCAILNVGGFFGPLLDLFDPREQRFCERFAGTRTVVGRRISPTRPACYLPRKRI
jgi:uncharacterized protein (TIGR00730 family)